MSLEFSKYAEQKLDGIYDFLFAQNERAAANTYNDILDEIGKLSAFPQMASVEQLLVGEPEMFRSLVVLRRYKVIYYMTNETIYVVDIWDCRQDPAILKESTTRR